MLPGGSIAELLEEAAIDPKYWAFGEVWISDSAFTAEPVFIRRSIWHRVRPHPGTAITFRAAPRGGNAGKSILGIVLGLATLALGFVLGPAVAGLIGVTTQTTTSLVTGLVVAATSIVGRLLISALIPPPPTSTQPGTPAVGTTYAVSGMRNQANLYGPVARLYGRHKIAPAYAAQPYTEIAGDDIFLRALFCIGYGPLQIDDIRIGETSIDDYEDVQYEVRQGYSNDPPETLYSSDVLEVLLVDELTTAAGWVQRTTQPNADEISIDITFDRGLYVVDTQTGLSLRWTVNFQLEYRLHGSSFGWTAVPGTPFDVSRQKTSMFRVNKRWGVPRGQYDVRLRRTTAEHPGWSNLLDHAVWTSIRTIRSAAPVRMTGVALIALRIRASGQLNGIIDQLTCVATSILPVFDGASWSSQPTRNPAWIYLDILRGSANKRPIADNRIYFQSFFDWAWDCDSAAANGQAKYRCDVVFDAAGTIFHALQTVASAGRATYGLHDGLYSVVRDVKQSVPIQHLSPRNSRDFRGSKVFVDLPHALKMQFTNEEADYVQDELIVYADGYDASNATKFETINLVGAGVVRPYQVWSTGRYLQATARLRPEIYELSTDAERLAARRGDLIRVTHDVPLWGLGQGRIKSLTFNSSGQVTAITLDEILTQLAGNTYALRIRKADGTSVLSTLNTVAGDSATLVLATPLAGGLIPAVGDLCLFGEAGRESVEVVITKITAEADFGARLTLVDAAPGIFDADTGPIPAFNPRITRPAFWRRQPPPVPIIAAIRAVA
jgi:hypothetical protein